MSGKTRREKLLEKALLRASEVLIASAVCPSDIGLQDHGYFRMKRKINCIGCWKWAIKKS